MLYSFLALPRSKSLKVKFACSCYVEQLIAHPFKQLSLHTKFCFIIFTKALSVQIKVIKEYAITMVHIHTAALATIIQLAG